MTTFFQFLGDHPILAFLLFGILSDTIVEAVKAARGPKVQP